MDALVYGGTLEWEKYKRFEGMSNEDMKKMDMKELEVYESNQMEKNAWNVAEELQRRLDHGRYLASTLRRS